MQKKALILFVFVLNADFAFGQDVVKQVPETCDFIVPNLSLVAEFEPNEYTCESGYYLPANHVTCEACPATHTCRGGTFVFSENVSQGLEYVSGVSMTTNANICAVNLPLSFPAVFEPNSHTCSAGYYLPAGVDECTICPVNNLCAGGTYSFNETVAQGIVACESGTYSPSGSAVCYQHILHVGDSNIYLRNTKLTTPSLNIQIGDDIFYANMTTIPTYMNKDSSHYLHILYEGDDYYVCDDTTYQE